MRLRHLLGVCVVCVLSAGCPRASMRGLFPSDVTMESRCQIGASQTSVLVTEWPAAEKANLESLLGGGAVAVAFHGCSMRLLPQCRLPGQYAWQRTTPSADVLEISSEADLYAKLPLGAASLGAELKKSGSLFVQTTVSGQKVLAGVSGQDVPNRPECAEATHVVAGLSIGAFVLSAGGTVQVSGAADVRAVGQVGGSYAQTGRLVRSAGDAAACSAATAEMPAMDCASPIQVFLSPIPGRTPPPGPPGTVRVDFVSASESVRWDVYVDDQATCTTPCARWVDPTRPLVMRSREDAPDKLRIPALDASAGPMQIAAKGQSKGRLVTGITFTALGGLAVITGIALTGVGCSDEDLEGMCTAGLITMPIGAVVTLGGLYLMRTSGARYGVRPIFAADGRMVPGAFVDLSWR